MFIVLFVRQGVFDELWFGTVLATVEVGIDSRHLCANRCNRFFVASCGMCSAWPTSRHERAL
jgi:hypothetical protein